MSRLWALLLLLVPVGAFQIAPRTLSVQPGLVSHKNVSRIPTSNHGKAPLAMSEESEESSSDKMEKKVKGRKKRVAIGYRVVIVGYVVSSILALVKGAPIPPYFVAGPLQAAGLAYVLVGAAKNDRLSSDTYKRLNLFLSYYGFIGLAIATMLKDFRHPVWIIPSFVAFVNSIKGYGYGLKGWELGKASPVDDIVDGCKSSIKCLVKVPNVKSAVYLAATLTVGTMKLLKLVDIIKLIGERDTFLVGTRLSRYARLAVLSAVSFTLKDAADRDRLEGTTFIELNFLSSAVFASMAAYLCREAGAVVAPLGAATAFFSVFNFAVGTKSIWKKKKKD